MATLLFVYNADSGLANALLDSLHKTFVPKTYSCKLCAVTYGLTSMKGEWRQFLKSLPYESQFLHRNEFHKAYPKRKDNLPAIFLLDGNLRVLVSSKELNAINTLPDLIALLRSRLPKAA